MKALTLLSESSPKILCGPYPRSWRWSLGVQDFWRLPPYGHQNISTFWKLFGHYTMDENVPSSHWTNPGERSYRYTILETNQIRLLKVYREDTAHVQFELLHVSLYDLPVEYTAISYTWGDPAIQQRLYGQDDESLGVTASAFAVLTWIIDLGNTGYLWIDQLCINQTGLLEKSQQVRLMGLIFTSAECTIAWLGNLHPKLILPWLQLR